MSFDIFRPGIFAGQVAIVSGGGSGIGRTTALQLASLGATVVICGRRAEPLEQTAALHVSASAQSAASAQSTASPQGAASAQSAAATPAAAPIGEILTAVCDVREEDQVDALMDTVLSAHGRIDVLVNNAGGQFLAPAEQITPKGFRTVIRLNVESAWLMTHAAGTKAMIPAGYGKVISVTLSPHNGMPGMVHSGAARAAVENMMKTLSIEWARYGIRCNAVAPGQIATDTFMTKYPKELVELMSTTIPAGRLGTPEEIAAAITYLASPAGDFISGATLTVDGSRDNWFGLWPPRGAADRDGTPLTEERTRPRS